MVGEKLADFIVEKLHWADSMLEKLSSSGYASLELLRLIIIGAHVLDLGVLDLLFKKGLALCNVEKHPGGKYILFGREVFNREEYLKLVRGIYLGCHSDTWGNYTFVSFGDHSGYTSEIMLEVLLEMDYTTRDDSVYRLLVPVFTPEDMAVMKTISSHLSRLVVEFIEENLEEIVSNLGDLKPYKWADFREIFTEAWHWIFGATNNILADRGYVAKPAAKSEGEAEHVKWLEVIRKVDSSLKSGIFY